MAFESSGLEVLVESKSRTERQARHAEFPETRLDRTTLSPGCRAVLQSARLRLRSLEAQEDPDAAVHGSP
jgi:hypothetical protein